MARGIKGDEVGDWGGGISEGKTFYSLLIRLEGVGILHLPDSQ